MVRLFTSTKNSASPNPFSGIDLKPLGDAVVAKTNIGAKVDDARVARHDADAAIAAAERELGVAELAGDINRMEAAAARLAEVQEARARAARLTAAAPQAVEEAHGRLIDADDALREQFTAAARPLIAEVEDRIRRSATDLAAALRVRAALRLEHEVPIMLPVDREFFDPFDPLPEADRKVLDDSAEVRAALRRSETALKR